MKGSVDLKFSSQAQTDLDGLGRIARRLLPTVIRDQLVDAAGTSLVEIPSANVDKAVPSDEIGGGLLTSQAHWYALPLVDDYSAIVRPFVDDGGVTGAVVGAIVDKKQVDELVAENEASETD